MGASLDAQGSLRLNSGINIPIVFIITRIRRDRAAAVESQRIVCYYGGRLSISEMLQQGEE